MILIYHLCLEVTVHDMMIVTFVKVLTGLHLKGMLCTNSNFKIVTNFWDTQNLLCETTTTTHNFVYNKIFGRNHSVDKSVVQNNVIGKFSHVAGFMKAVPGSVQYSAAVDSDSKVPVINNTYLKLSEV